MTTRDKLIERVAAVLVPDMDPTDTMVQVDTEARAAAIVDALGLVVVETTLKELAACHDWPVFSHGGVSNRALLALSKLRGEQS